FGGVENKLAACCAIFGRLASHRFRFVSDQPPGKLSPIPIRLTLIPSSLVVPGLGPWSWSLILVPTRQSVSGGVTLEVRSRSRLIDDVFLTVFSQGNLRL
ncbi:MAG: hypothetical protein Q8R95_04615, partial [Azonexus sp.]|nr:hypothetical protein [Azonexus sp.]